MIAGDLTAAQNMDLIQEICSAEEMSAGLTPMRAV